ncbi:MAG: hypothetical protein ACOYJD_08915 [Christensenellales bacterium]
MFEGIDRNEALEYILGKMKSEPGMKGVPHDEMERLTEAAMTADAEFMEQSGVNEGGVYDEDEAYEFICDKLGEGCDDEHRALASLITDAYLEYWDEYLDKKGLIDWE